MLTLLWDKNRTEFSRAISDFWLSCSRCYWSIYWFYTYTFIHTDFLRQSLMLLPFPLSLSSTVSPNSLFSSFSLESENTYMIMYFRSFKKEETNTNNLHYSLHRQTLCFGHCLFFPAHHFPSTSCTPAKDWKNTS